LKIASIHSTPPDCRNATAAVQASAYHDYRLQFPKISGFPGRQIHSDRIRHPNHRHQQGLYAKIPRSPIRRARAPRSRQHIFINQNDACVTQQPSYEPPTGRAWRFERTELSETAKDTSGIQGGLDIVPSRKARSFLSPTIGPNPL